MSRTIRLSIYGVSTVLILILLAFVAGFFTYRHLEPQLPSIETLKDVRLQVPLRIYARTGGLIAEFGEIKRKPLQYAELPPQLIQSFLAAEDDSFFAHPGVDIMGLMRAAFHLLRTGEKEQGGSTITMQVARNFFLSREKTYLRKANEILLSLKIERELGKEDIFELYLNKIYLGQRAYGIGAAAQVYYGKEVDDLNLAQIAMLAGLPKAPSAFNPVTNPERALLRRNYVLNRMLELGYIEEDAYQQAIGKTVTAQLHSPPIEVEAPYVAEMVRAQMVEEYGDEVYGAGLKVYTTLDGRLQRAANHAVRRGLLDYEQRHGYRGAHAHVGFDEESTMSSWHTTLEKYVPMGNLHAALVTQVEEQTVSLYSRERGLLNIEWDGLKWARPYIDENATGVKPQQAADILQPGDIVHVTPRIDGNGWELAQLPQVSGALVSLNPEDGALIALVGGFDFYQSKFNRVTQAQRQAGSSFKPFIYSVALAHGFTPASIINDAPVVVEDNELEAGWRPENYSRKFFGPTRLREALVHSRNLVSIRLLRTVGITRAINYIKGFGFAPERLPRYLSLSLGSAAVTPWETVRGYAVFANGGYLIEPYFIERIEDIDGNVIFQADPAVACHVCTTRPATASVTGAGELVEEGNATTTEELESLPRLAPRAIDERVAYLVTTMMQDVIRRGTGRRARALERRDIAGKTGTTNDQIDAWFSGFNRHVVATTWVGFDSPRSLGNREAGSRAALPMWIDFMREALRDTVEATVPEPPGLITVRIDPETGEYATANTKDALFERFREGNAPQPPTATAAENVAPVAEEHNQMTEQLF